MYLKSILIHGFKSFAEKTALEFSAPESSGRLPLTAIVGPNGSGKSNIADAVRWVLGEQSIKAVRGKKSEDVIFAGSSRRSRASVAEVQLAVVNDDRRIPLEEDEVVIARRLYRDGQSEYLLNNRVSRLMDIQMLLARAAFGKEGYSVISQGQTDAILAASPEERKAFFDEATGVRPLQIKKDQALKKLAATEENLNRAIMLKEELEPRMRSLTRQVRRLEKREEVERELHELQLRYFGTLLHEIGMEHGAHSRKIREIEERKNEKTAELKKIESEMKTLEKEETKPAEFLNIQTEYEKLTGSKENLREREFELKRAMLESKKERVMVPPDEIVRILEGVRSELTAMLLPSPGLRPSSPLGLPAQAGRGEGEGRLRTLLATVTDLLARLKGKHGPHTAQQTSGELEKIAKDLAAVDRDLERLKAEMQKVGQAAEEKKRAFFDVQRRLSAKQSELHAVEAELGSVRIELARIDTRKEDLEKEARAEMGERYLQVSGFRFQVSEQQQRNQQELMSDIQRLKRQLELIGGVDEETMKEYQEVKTRFEFLQNQIADLEGSLKSLTELLEELGTTIQSQFENAFQKINGEFGNYFRILFGGGQAKLSKIVVKEEEEEEEGPSTSSSNNNLVLERSPRTELRSGAGLHSAESKGLPPSILDKFTKRDPYRGVEIHATPPGKKLKSIAMLSGGEKALTSIALLSAILALNPPPFVILDEVDAALDETNSARFASILTELANRTQFIVVTHNRATMQAAEVLYGVTMGDDGVSKILSLKFEEAQETVRSR